MDEAEHPGTIYNKEGMVVFAMADPEGDLFVYCRSLPAFLTWYPNCHFSQREAWRVLAAQQPGGLEVRLFHAPAVVGERLAS